MSETASPVEGGRPQTQLLRKQRSQAQRAQGASAVPSRAASAPRDDVRRLRVGVEHDDWLAAFELPGHVGGLLLDRLLPRAVVGARARHVFLNHAAERLGAERAERHLDQVRRRHHAASRELYDVLAKVQHLGCRRIQRGFTLAQPGKHAGNHAEVGRAVSLDSAREAAQLARLLRREADTLALTNRMSTSMHVTGYAVAFRTPAALIEEPR